MRQRRGGILLAALLAGMVSAAADSLENHMAVLVPPAHSEGGATSHLVGQHAARTAPCSACVFSKMLRQGLLVASAVPADLDIFGPHWIAFAATGSHAAVHSAVDRGPPF